MAPADTSGEHRVGTAGQWWGEAATKVAVALMCAGMLGLGGWMFSMYTQLITLGVKLDGIHVAISEAKTNGTEAKTMARANTREIDKLHSTQLTAEDVQRMLAPLEYRITQLESRRKR